MARSAKIKFKKEGVEVQGTLLVEGAMEVLGATTYTGGVALAGAISGDSLASTANTDVGADLDVVGATTLNGDVDLGDAAADDVTVNGSLASDLNFKTGAARKILGPASNDLTVEAPAARQLVLKSNAVDALVCGAAGAVTVPLGLTVTAGGLGITAGGLTVTAGGALVTAGDLEVTAGDIKLPGANGAILTVKRIVGFQAIAGGANTETINNVIPAKAQVLGVTARIFGADFTSSDGGVSWSLGDGTTVDQWGTGLGFAQGEVVTPATWKSTWAPKHYAAATSLVLTMNGGKLFAATGSLRYAIYYLDWTTPTS